MGYVFPVLVGWWVLRERRTPDVAAPEHTARAMLMESVNNAQVLVVFFALSSVDIVIARNVLDEHDAHYLRGGKDEDLILVSIFNPAITGDEKHTLSEDGFSSY